jgi:hypothetical protein
MIYRCLGDLLFDDEDFHLPGCCVAKEMLCDQGQTIMDILTKNLIKII